jgi:hypothetical protein
MTSPAQQVVAPDPSAQPGLGVLTDFDQTMDADPRDFSQQQLRELRVVFENLDIGLFLFAYYVCGFNLLTEHLHLPLSRIISRWGRTDLKDGTYTYDYIHPLDPRVKQSFRRLMICIPRDCYKTTIGTKANALWTVAKDPTHNPTVAIFNENANNAEKFVGSICEIVESSRWFQKIWPEMLPPGISLDDKKRGVARPRSWKWGPTGLKFVRDAVGVSELSIEPHGIGGTAVGMHYSHKILDDIIGEKAVKSSDSQAIMQQAIHWMDNSRPLERPAERGLELICHTPWAYADVYAHALKRWPNEYQVYRRHILENEQGEPDAINGTSIFPEKMSTLEAKLLLKKDVFVNSSQYMCLPRPGRDTSFDSAWLKFGRIVHTNEEPVFRIRDEDYSPEIFDSELTTGETAPQYIPLSWMSKAVLFDPVPGKPTELKKEPNCAHGLVAVGKDPWGRRFCFESQRHKCSPEEIFDYIMLLYQKWHCSLLAIEEVSFSYVYFPLFQQLAERRYDFMPDMFPTKPGGRQKDQRILENLQSPHETGYWYYNQAGTAEIVEEITEFPHSTYKDTVDPLSYTDEVLLRPDTPGEAVRNYYESKSVEQSRGVAGYGW